MAVINYTAIYVVITDVKNVRQKRQQQQHTCKCNYNTIDIC